MIRMYLSLVATVVASIAVAEEPKSEQALEFERTRLKGFAENAKRVNGARLTAEVQIEGENLRIDWTLDYDGPRPPLTTLKPMYPENSFGATSILVIVSGAKREQSVHLNQFESSSPNKADPRPGRDAYLTIAKGEAATGTITVPSRKVKEKLFAKGVPADRLPAELYVGLMHRPTLRGGEFGLDAWTVGQHGGECLYTIPHRVVVRKW